MLTEPIGPRSPDEILAAVYQRTERARRRRRQHVGAGMAAMALGVAGLLSLRTSDEEASRVRVVDDPRPEAVEEADTAATTLPVVPASPSTDKKAAPKRPSSPAGATPGNASNPSPTAPPVPTTTTTVPLPNGPSSKLLAQATDTTGDAALPGWWYDVVSGSMELDLRSDMVLFTTQYAMPQGSDDRDDRTLRTEFVYDGSTITVDVTETDNTLGTVQFDGDCNVCTKSFDTAQGRLVVGVPIDVMNDFLERYHGNGHSIEDAVVSSLRMVTRVAGEVEADETGGAQ